MGSSSSKSENEMSQIAIDLRLALRAADGPTSETDISESEGNKDKKKNEDDQKFVSPSSPQHRSHRVLEILSNPAFNPEKDLHVEHILELVDNEWQENYEGTTKVLTKIIDEIIGGVLLASPQQEMKAVGFLEKVIIQCALYQRCWFAMHLAIDQYIRHLHSRRDGKKDTDAQHVALFNVIILSTPLRLVSKIITELKWVATQQQQEATTKQSLQKSQFRLLTQRLAREHAPLKTEEQKMSATTKSNLQSEFVQKLTKPDEEASKQVLIDFLRVSGAADFLDTEKDVKEAAEIQTSDAVKEILKICTKPWSQVEATVGDVPMSWTCSGCNKRQFVTQTALVLQKKGLTFPAGARVLSFLVCPCGEKEEKK